MIKTWNSYTSAFILFLRLFLFLSVSCGVLCSVAQSCQSLRYPMDCSPPGSSVHGDSLGKNTGVGKPFPPPGDLPNTGIKPGSLMSPALQAGSLPQAPPGKPIMGTVFV